MTKLNPKTEEYFNRVLLGKDLELKSEVVMQPERSKREDSMYGMKAEIDENGILTMKNGDKFDLRDAVL